MSNQSTDLEKVQGEEVLDNNSVAISATLASVKQQLKVQNERLEMLHEEVKALRLQRSPDGNFEVDEAAELARISRRKLEELIHAGEVPSMKIGRRRLIPRRAFTAWLRSKAEGGGHE